MSEITPIPTGLVAFVTRFPGLTASGISSLMQKRSDWASGSLCRLVKAGRLRRRWVKGMKSFKAWRYYPVPPKPKARRLRQCPSCSARIWSTSCEGTNRFVKDRAGALVTETICPRCKKGAPFTHFDLHPARP